MSTVTGRYTDAQGTPMTGTVYLSPAARAGIGQPPDIVTEKRVWQDLDAQGSISIDVIPSDDPGWLIDGEMPYLVEERLTQLPYRSYWIGVPDAGVDLSQVQQVEPDVAYVPVPGPPGPQGIQGPEGPQGPPGEDFTPADADARYVNATGDTMTGPLTVPVPSAATQVPRLARNPNAATGDLGLPGYAGSDTGWRDVSSLLINGWVQATGQRCRMRRSESTVQWAAFLKPDAATADVCMELSPGVSTGPGFGFYGYDVTGRWIQVSAVTSGDAVIQRMNGTIYLYKASNEATSNVFVSLTWITDDPWPTSLPGTAVTQPAAWS